MTLVIVDPDSMMRAQTSDCQSMVKIQSKCQYRLVTRSQFVF
jgi:hypothetical protein